MQQSFPTERDSKTEASTERDSAVVLSQREYRPTPYEPSDWEIVGDQFDDREFSPMVLEVMLDARCRPDPMFDVFGKPTAGTQGEEFVTPGGSKRKSGKKEKEEQAPAFDPQVIEAQLTEQFNLGREEGYAAGLAEAENKINEKHQEITKRMQAVTTQLIQEINGRLDRTEQQALRMSLEIAKKILDTTVEMKPDYILDIIRSGLRNLGAAKPVRVRVSPQDYEFLEVVGLPADLTPTEIGVQYASDESIKAGCVIETDFGEVNLELDQMWEQVKQNLYAVCE